MSHAVRPYVFGLMVLMGCVGLLTAPAQAQDVPLVGDGPRTWIDLDGTWQMRPIPGLDFAYPPPSDGWQDVAVPHERAPGIALMRGSYGPNQLKDFFTEDGKQFKRTDRIGAWFRRPFTLPTDLPANTRALLHFEGIAFRSEVWFNGKKVGTWIQGLVPVSYDVTDLIKPGQVNTIELGLTAREGVVDPVRQTYMAPARGVNAGIWDSVRLQFVPEVRIDDVFIKTFVKDKRIVMETTLVNESHASASVTLGARVLDPQGVIQTTLPGKRVTLDPGQTKVVNLEKDWLAPLWWSHHSPSLYRAQVELRAGANVMDRTSHPFGFREFEIRGRDFYLNGQPIQLLRESTLIKPHISEEEGFRNIRLYKDRSCNTIRPHIGFLPRTQLDAADQLGVLVTPEASWHRAVLFPKEHSEVWLDNVSFYIESLIKRHRNRPSVVIWDLTNETYWQRTDPQEMAIAEHILSVARAADDTRPMMGDAENTWGGRLPIINIHYPEWNLSDSLGATYSNSGWVYPNDLYWLADDPKVLNRTWRGDFHWDRPLFIGEYWAIGGEPDKYSSFMGESIYDWETWRIQDLAGRDGEANAYSRAVERMTDVYRVQGVAGINAWGGDREHAMATLAVRSLNFHVSGYGGTTVDRRMVVFNDSGQGPRVYRHMSLHCRLVAVDGRILWDRTFPAPTDPGHHTVVDLAIPLPQVQAPVEATLIVRLQWLRGAEQRQLGRRVEEPLFIMPRPNLGDVDPASIVLLDDQGATAKALSAMGLTLSPRCELKASDLDHAKALIVGQGVSPKAYKEIIASFVKRGGGVLVLQQDRKMSLAPGLPRLDPLHVATQTWKRTYDHPILEGIDDRQLSYWQPDHRVVTKSFRKDANGRVRYLLDSGGRYGLQWSGLVEMPLDNGTYVLSQLHLADAADAEPVAARILAQAIRYVAQPRLPGAIPRPLRLLAGQDDQALRDALNTAEVLVCEGIDGEGPVLIAPSYTLSDSQISQLRSEIENGGKVWLHGFDHDHIKQVAGLFPFEPMLEDYDPTIQSAARRSNDPLINNLSSYDFFWTHVDTVARGDFFVSGKPTTKLGGQVLTLPTLEAGQPLVTPALLVKVPVGKGVILFDNLKWEHALGGEPMRSPRIVGSLAANLGAAMVDRTETPQYATFAVDLSSVANMGYYDPTPDDGQGGWTDQGNNDMRFFLINHTGREEGRDDGLPVETKPFPKQVEFNGRPFTLLNPKTTGHKAIVSLRGGEHGIALPAQATDIAVNRKADVLWFLHTTGWDPSEANAVVARYVIHYDDGTKTVFPVRFGMEVGGWWKPQPLSRAQVAWTGRNMVHTPVGVYTTAWENPFPDKTIASIDLLGNQTATQVLVLAITGGVAESSSSASGPTAGMKLISRWDFAAWKPSAATPHQISNQVDQAPPLRMEPNRAPTIASIDGEQVLQFRQGQRLTGQTPGRLPGANAKALALQLRLAVDGPPQAYYSGIFQAMTYGANGFRLMLTRKMTLLARSHPQEPEPIVLRGATELEPNQLYDVTLVYDQGEARLYVDGRLDAKTQAPLPAPYQGQMFVGDASGNHYHFSGAIQHISLLTRDP